MAMMLVLEVVLELFLEMFLLAITPFLLLLDWASDSYNLRNVSNE